MKSYSYNMNVKMEIITFSAYVFSNMFARMFLLIIVRTNFIS